MTETLTLICVRVDPIFEPVAGSVVVQCDKCGHDVWASPASLLAVAGEHDDGQLLCVDCVSTTLDEMPLTEPVEIRLPTEAQLDEVRRELRRDK